jgi:Xaa-Pro aminopeptidase
VALMRDACAVSSDAMVDAMAASVPGVSEHFLDAKLE